MYKNLNIIICILTPFLLKSQVPNTDLWLFKTGTDKAKQSILKDPLNITNREGYDNQPFFSADGKKIYYVSIKDDKQADVYYYDLGSKKNIPFTKSKVSEYSPTLTEDGKMLASVVVEDDSAQRIHFINTVTGLDEKKLGMDSVGYFTFLNTDTLIYYKLTKPHSLRSFSKSTNEDKWLADSPIRTFKAINRHTLLYGINDSTKVSFYIYDFILHKAELYATSGFISEDIIWHPVWKLVRSEENRLMRFDELKKEWVVLFDLSGFGIKKITRFTFDPKNKYLVVVNNL